MIRKNLGRQVDKDVISQAEAGEALDLIHTSTDLEKTVSNVDLVVEAVSERAEVKADVFRSIDAAAPPDAILASNTSSISITWIRSEEHTSELQSRGHLVCRLLLETKKK